MILQFMVELMSEWIQYFFVIDMKASYIWDDLGISPIPGYLHVVFRKLRPPIPRTILGCPQYPGILLRPPIIHTQCSQYLGVLLTQGSRFTFQGPFTWNRPQYSIYHPWMILDMAGCEDVWFQSLLE